MVFSLKNFFPPSSLDSAFLLWTPNGLLKINDLYEKGVFASFSSLSKKYNLPSHHLFRFFQIRHFIKKQFPHFPKRRRHLISVIYILINSITVDPTDTFKDIWEQDLGVSITEDLWHNILNQVHSSSICARHGLIQCKILFRAHLTNAQLANIFPDRSAACNRCKQSPANHLHMFWTCPKLATFWSYLFETLKKALNINIVPDPFLALFGVSPMPDLMARDRKVMAFTTILARRAILLKWKHPSPPSHDRWIQDIFYCVGLEKLRCSLSGSLKSFYKTWDPLGFTLLTSNW